MEVLFIYKIVMGLIETKTNEKPWLYEPQRITKIPIVELKL